MNLFDRTDREIAVVEALLRAGRWINYTVAFVALSLVLFCAGRIAQAFYTGRVAQVLHNIVEHADQEVR